MLMNQNAPSSPAISLWEHLRGVAQRLVRRVRHERLHQASCDALAQFNERERANVVREVASSLEAALRAARDRAGHPAVPGPSIF